eukprot:2239717-Lingulodinium_polyedra.AAC.1
MRIAFEGRSCPPAPATAAGTRNHKLQGTGPTTAQLLHQAAWLAPGRGGGGGRQNLHAFAVQTTPA